MGLMPHHMGILADLWRKDGIRQQDLVVSLIKDKATIARAIASMEQANVVVRIQDERDKRYKRIYLTHKGKSLKEELIPQMESLEKEVASNIDEEAYQNCLDVLEKIHDLLLK
jgi:DNA-binding MarR family transcriptional regulator